MGIIGNDVRMEYEWWINFWEVLEGISGKTLSTLGPGLV